MITRMERKAILGVSAALFLVSLFGAMVSVAGSAKVGFATLCAASLFCFAVTAAYQPKE